MKKLLLVFLLSLCSVYNADAQRIDYDKTSNFYWGFNIGHTWHSSDVKNIKDRFPLGAGLILGASMNQDYGKLFTYDLRVRYLGGVWYGHDTDTTSFGQGNYAFKPAFDSLGYALKNFKSVQHSLDLEFSIHFNRLKERSGIDPYLFAGIGYVGTRTKGDINATKEMNVKNLIYDTPLDKNENGEFYDKKEFRTQLLPSLGVGIGYFFNSRFSLGIEHRSTFFRGDYFDGTTIDLSGNPSKIENDIYHYTSIYFKWYFKPKEEREVRERNPNVSVTNPIDYEPEPVKVIPPTVRFTNPATSGTQTTNQNYTIRADVQHVSSASNLMFRQNNRIISSFVYNPNTGIFESNVVLQPGENTFYLYGSNDAGNDSDQTIIIYRENQRLLPPIVNIVDPPASPHTVNNLNYIVKASIENISSRNQLTVVFNDKLFNDYSFTSGSSINFTANLNLTAGINTLTITGTNDVGTDRDETVIIYTRQPTSSTGYPPKVNITTPSVSPYSTTKGMETVIAQVENVSSKNEIDVKINGVSTTNFSFNASTNTVALNAHLVSGNNAVRIIATNNYGSDMDETHFITSRSPQAPPVVNIVTPSSRPYTTTQNKQKIEATVENINEKQQLEVKVNGNIISNFYFNSALKTLQFDAQLTPGNNNVFIQGTNIYGSNNDETQIVYNPPSSPKPPSVQIISPVANPHSSSNNTEVVIATTNHITNKSQVDVKVNGQSTQNFTFNTSTKQVRLNANLTAGSNIVSIKVSNEFGTDTDERQILYRTPVVQNPPTVTIFTPAANPHTTSKNKETIMASTSNVDTKSQVEVKVNGTITNSFTFNTTNKQVQLTTDLAVGNNMVSIKAVNEYGMALDERLIVYQREPAKTPPTVVITQPTVSPYSTRKETERIVAKTTHIANKSQVTVTINGVPTDDFAFNAATQTVQLDAKLKIGSNSIQIGVANADGDDSAEALITYRITARVPDNVIVDKLPCTEKEYPSLQILTPKNTTTTVHIKEVDVNAMVSNITSKDEIKVFFNGQERETFAFNTTTHSLTDKLGLNEGTNTYRIVLSNLCKTVEYELVFIYRPLNCDVAMDLAGDGQVCIITPNGTITNSNLIDNGGLTYNGTATNVYFKAKENGTATVNNQVIQIVKGNFYHFQGNLAVNLKQENNSWMICVESSNPPLFGTGRSKPVNPCAGQNNKPGKETVPVRVPSGTELENPRLTKPDNNQENQNSKQSPEQNRRPVRNP